MADQVRKLNRDDDELPETGPVAALDQAGPARPPLLNSLAVANFRAFQRLQVGRLGRLFEL